MKDKVNIRRYEQMVNGHFFCIERKDLLVNQRYQICFGRNDKRDREIWRRDQLRKKKCYQHKKS